MAGSESLDIPQAMQAAVRCFQAGELQQAERICRDILTFDAGCAAANHLLGVVEHRQGRSDEGLAHIRKALETDPGVADAHNNLGNILRDIGRLDEAISSFRHAIDLQPGFAMAHYNLGAAYRGNGDADLAVKSYRRALEFEPNNSAVHNNLGNALRDLGDLDDAARSYARAISLNPDGAEAHFNLAELLRRRGDQGAALTAYVKALGARPDHVASIRGLGLLLDGRTFADVAGNSVPQARAILLGCLGRDDVEHQDFYHAAMGILATGEVLDAIGSFVAKAADDPADLSFAADRRITALLADPLFQLVLQRTTVVHESIEKLLAAIRGSLLFNLPGAGFPGKDAVDTGAAALAEGFVYALASQCFMTEYVYEQSAAEEEAVGQLINRIGEQIASGSEGQDYLLALLACYESLSSHAVVGNLQDTTGTVQLADLLDTQIRQPALVRSIADSVESFSVIDDEVSRDVRRQYEENPYPPWTGTYVGRPLSFVECLETDIFPCSAPTGVALVKPDVLIAGCGTGKHAIDSALRYANSNVLAIDLSLHSIAYGKRKADQLGVGNIEFLHADILDLEKLDRRFDVIESVGVLHHMAEPRKGWSILTGLLRPGGFMKIGLYSSRARKDVAAVRRYVQQQGFDSSPRDIRKCRQAIFALPETDPARAVTHSIDFYSMSAARDFLFHVQEHVFTLPDIEAALQEEGLDFLGFVIDVFTMQTYRSRFPDEGSFLSLEKWDQYEREYPRTFGAMYQFWTRKFR